jgi:hypothetical protein
MIFCTVFKNLRAGLQKTPPPERIGIRDGRFKKPAPHSAADGSELRPPLIVRPQTVINQATSKNTSAETAEIGNGCSASNLK